MCVYMCQLLKYVNGKLDKLANQAAASQPSAGLAQSGDSASAQLLKQILAALPANAARSNIGVEADGSAKAEEERVLQLLLASLEKKGT